MATSDQYRAEHRCSTCVVWMPHAYDYGHCHRHPHVIKKHSTDFCSEHIPDEPECKFPDRWEDIYAHIDLPYDYCEGRR